MPPIVLPPSPSHDALVVAIQQASALNVPLLLEPGTHFTKPGRLQKIAIGSNGLQLGLAPAPATPPQGSPPAVIKRPDFAINLQASDDNYGLFFIPSAPTDAELSGISSWKPYVDEKGQRSEFAVVIRGEISISGVSVDCNMGQQGLANKAAEHSAMLGFAGQRYSTKPSPTGVPRLVYMGFKSVTLRDVSTLNGGFADDVWFSRGYFNPNIESVTIERLTSTNRVSPRRATISFSGLCQNVDIRDLDIYSLHLEEASSVTYDNLPRQSDVFQPSVWKLGNIRAKGIGLAAKASPPHGNVYTLEAANLTASEAFGVFQAGGIIKNSTLRPGSEDSRLFRLNDLTFDHVTWLLDPDSAGVVRGLIPASLFGDPCIVTFLDNTFLVNGNATGGAIINSQYSPAPLVPPVPPVPLNRVTVTATGCHYPEPFGRSAAMPIAFVRERGDWTFAVHDFGDRPLATAIVKGPQPDIFFHRV
jgi:hypothetical protein